jgi:hypothetical protein
VKRNAREAIFPSHVQPNKEASCKTRTILTNRLRADVKVYADAIRALQQSIGKDFEQAHKRAERARRAYEAARDKLNRHSESHGCG